MADKVDVLAVMDEVVALMESQTPTPLNLPGESHEHPCRVIERTAELRAARNAVAELIEADKEYDRIRWAPYDRHDPIASREAREQFIAAQDRRAASLATLGGSR